MTRLYIHPHERSHHAMSTTARFRYDGDRWRAVQDRAAAENRTASDVVRTLLDSWLDGNDTDPSTRR